MSDKTIKKLQSLKINIEQLQLKVGNHMGERLSAERYIYATTYKGWIQEYNNYILEYNNVISANLSTISIADYELSETKKTVRNDAAKTFLQSIANLIKTVEVDIKSVQCKDDSTPTHQMRVCFKIGVSNCPLKPVEEKNKVFIAMPFDDIYKDSYEYGIKLALDAAGFSHYRADENLSNKSVMCKICEEIQTCGRFIANISGLNPNVMLELGLAYGIGKNVIIVKDKGTKNISDLGSIEYIEYAHASDLCEKLLKIL